MQVGHQFNYTGAWGGVTHIVQQVLPGPHQPVHVGPHQPTNVAPQDGVRGLFRGANAALPRVAVGGATQLASYDYFKAFAPAPAAQ